MNLFGVTENCDHQSCCDEIAAAINNQTTAIEAILVKLFQGVSANIDSQAKSLTRIAKSIAKLADAYVQQQDYNINPILQQIITAIQVQIAETSVKLNLLQQLYTQIQQEQVNIRTDITSIRQDISSVQSQVTNIVQQGPGGPPQAPPAVAVNVSIASPVTVVGPTIDVDVAPPPPPPAAISISLSQSQQGPEVNVEPTISVVLPSISNVVNAAGAMVNVSAQGGQATARIGDVTQRIGEITQNLYETVQQWQSQSQTARPISDKPDIPTEPKKGDRQSIDPLQAPVAWRFGSDDDDWRDASIAWGGLAFAALEYSPTLNDMANLYVRLLGGATR